MKILIIDDERSIRNALKDILEMDNHTVALACDGKEGVETMMLFSVISKCQKWMELRCLTPLLKKGANHP